MVAAYMSPGSPRPRSESAIWKPVSNIYIPWGPDDASRYLGFGEYVVVIYFGQYQVGLQEVVEVFPGSCSMHLQVACCVCIHW